MGSHQDTVRVEGLKELRRALGQIDPVLQRNLRGRLKTIGDKVAARARQLVPVRSGRAQGSIKAGVSGNTAYVQGGRKTVPYYGWLDFGGTLQPSGRRTGTQVRERIQGGRFLYRAVREKRNDTQREAIEALNETARELGLM